MEIRRLPLTGASVPTPLDFTRAGMPSLDAIQQSLDLAPVPGGPTYQILRTTEFDSYETNAAATAMATLLRQEAAPSKAALLTALKKQPPISDNFAGTARKLAKLSVATAKSEQFNDVRDLVNSLTSDDAMINHTPAISTAATSDRVKEEKRNIRITGFLYAASRETDNDFHLIVGRDPSKAPETYMTMEISGLPPTASPAFQALKAARDSFQGFFKSQLPQMTYDFYNPPIPVIIEGSLFFDMTHAQGQHPGPPSLKSRMPTIWEVHPITSITLGP
jgi:hypothetical protein